ncbi:brachyurin-like isoform X1 [Aethina tumida]|uniref:brachyurin-like isoform X1 n=1 Tax=Aethina tumida TaxID=116153 RepID=UPI0021474DE8|nr:brachyurin-like isoform X1 [Aethina tumida]
MFQYLMVGLLLIILSPVECIVGGQPTTLEQFSTSLAQYKGNLFTLFPSPISDLLFLLPPRLGVFDRFAQVIALSPQHILTVGHVIPLNEENRTQASFFQNCQYILDFDNYDIINCTVHPDFQVLQNEITTYAINDIAICKVDKPLSSNIPLITIPTSNIASGTVGRTAGWGKTNPNNTFGSECLNKCNMTIVDQASCNTLYNGIIADYHICAINTNGAGPCGGDSGSPLIINLDGVDYSVGLTSFAKDCASTTFPSVYTNLSYFQSWIENIVKSDK